VLGAASLLCTAGVVGAAVVAGDGTLPVLVGEASRGASAPDQAATAGAGPGPTTTVAVPAPPTTSTTARTGAAAPRTTATTPRASTPTTTRTASAKAAAASTGYALSRTATGALVRWDPCSTITWKVNLALAPAGALAQVQQAVATLSAATGLRFAFGGTTTSVPTSTWLDKSTAKGTLLVAWAPTTTTDLFQAGAIGEGGWWATTSSAAATTASIQRGFVVLDPTSTASLASGFGSGASLGAVLLHELGHAVGLQHVQDRSQVMYPTVGPWSTARYAPGDLAGLAAVGSAGARC
jgi:hypothetical protein